MRTTDRALIETVRIELESEGIAVVLDQESGAALPFIPVAVLVSDAAFSRALEVVQELAPGAPMVPDQPTTLHATSALPWPERHPVVTGLTMLVVFHALLIFGPLQGVTGMKPVAEPLFIGVVQLVYVVPLSVILFVAGYRRTFKAVALGALVTFALNATACGAFIYIMNQGVW